MATTTTTPRDDRNRATLDWPATEANLLRVFMAATEVDYHAPLRNDPEMVAMGIRQSLRFWIRAARWYRANGPVITWARGVKWERPVKH